MIRFVFVLFVVSLFSQSVFSQVRTETNAFPDLPGDQDYSQGDLQITQDESLDMLLLRYQKLNYKEKLITSLSI